MTILIKIKMILKMYLCQNSLNYLKSNDFSSKGSIPQNDNEINKIIFSSNSKIIVNCS